MNYMKKAVFFGWKAKSNFNESLSMLEKMIKSNVEVYYFGFKEYRHAIEERGISFFEYMNNEEMWNETFFKQNKKLEYTVEDVVTRSNIFHRNLLMMFKTMADHDFQRVKEISPDIIFRDNDALNGKIIGEKLGKLTVGINFLITILNDDVKNNPIELFGLFNSTDLSGIKGINDKDFYSAIIDGHIKNCIDLEVPYSNPVHVVDGEDDINISFGGNLIQPERTVNNKQYIVVKPLLRNMYIESEVDEELEKFTMKKGKLIYFSTGSMIRASNNFYNILINSIRKTDYKLIISVPNLSKNYSKVLPENILVREMVNQQKVLNRADLFITAGGYNSICEAIYNLVPMIVKPIINDQAYNAYKVKELEIGEVIKDDNISKELLIQYIELVMNDKKYENNLRNVRDNFSSSKDMQIVLDSIISNI